MIKVFYNLFFTTILLGLWWFLRVTVFPKRTRKRISTDTLFWRYKNATSSRVSISFVFIFWRFGNLPSLLHGFVKIQFAVFCYHILSVIFTLFRSFNLFLLQIGIGKICRSSYASTRATRAARIMWVPLFCCCSRRRTSGSTFARLRPPPPDRPKRNQRKRTTRRIRRLLQIRPS